MGTAAAEEEEEEVVVGGSNSFLRDPLWLRPAATTISAPLSSGEHAPSSRAGSGPLREEVSAPASRPRALLCSETGSDIWMSR